LLEGSVFSEKSCFFLLAIDVLLVFREDNSEIVCTLFRVVTENLNDFTEIPEALLGDSHFDFTLAGKYDDSNGVFERV
jgi:hypothetical protein